MTTRATQRSLICCAMTSAGVPGTTRRSTAGPCGRIGQDVFETLVQQRIGAIEVVRQPCPSAEGIGAKGVGFKDLEYGQRSMAYCSEGATQGDSLEGIPGDMQCEQYALHREDRRQRRGRLRC